MERIKGFTLVELVLTITLLGIIVVVSGILMGRGVDAYRLVSARSDAVHEARIGLLRMQKELETLREFRNIAADRIRFTDPNLAEVEFRLDGTTLLRGNDVLARNIQNLVFTCFQDNGNETNAAPQARRVHIDLTVDAGAGNGTLSLRTDVFPRIFIYENFQ